MDTERHIDESLENDIPDPDLVTEGTDPTLDDERVVEDVDGDFDPEDLKYTGGQAEPDGGPLP